MIPADAYRWVGYPGLGCCEERQQLLMDKLRLYREILKLAQSIPENTTEENNEDNDDGR